MRGTSNVQEVAVAIVGGGLSGLAAARELAAHGVDDVVVLEAQDAVGGRVRGFTRPDGSVLETGAEFVGDVQGEVSKLIAEFGLETIPWAWDTGRTVRLFEGNRYVEAIPGESDPQAGPAFAKAVRRLTAMTAEVPADAPWAAPHAAEWDRITIAQWLADNVPSATARQLLLSGFLHTTDNAQTSLLYLLWLQARFGGWGEYDRLTERLVGGTSQLPRLLAERLTCPIRLSTPVRRVTRDAGGVTLRTDDGAVRAQAVIFAVEPGQVSMIEFEPPLPPARALLQARWHAAQGGKGFVVYDTPFWREDGLSGMAFGPAPISMVIDVSPPDAHEGILFFPLNEPNAVTGEYSHVLDDPEQTRRLALDRLVEWFGPAAAEPTEFHLFTWFGHRWAQGCTTCVPTGVLTTVGWALREPVGPFSWAGADAGEQDWMDGAITAGQRAAREAVARLAVRADTDDNADEDRQTR